VAAPSRGCPICSAVGTRELHRQRFTQPGAQRLADSYRVVVCARCGLAYADGVPSQEALDRHYRELSKYEGSGTAEATAPHDEERLTRVAEAIARLLPDRGQEILEVGCATGRFLWMLRSAGYERLRGLDPSPACRRSAAEVYGVEAVDGTAGDLAARGDRYDLVIALAVLEHVRDVGEFVRQLGDLLKPGGFLYVQVPDAAAFHLWPGAPFQEFSTEHINFFSRVSLRNLMARGGLHEAHCARYEVPGPQGTAMAVLDALFRPGEPVDAAGLERDEDSEPALREYVRRCGEVDRRLQAALAALAGQGRPVLVWGAGTHTQRLLAEGRLAGVQIVAFVDANPHLRGNTLAGRPIIPPGEVRAHSEPIVISSLIWQDDIERQIREAMRLPNEIVTLYGDSGPLRVPLA